MPPFTSRFRVADVQQAGVDLLEWCEGRRRPGLSRVRGCPRDIGRLRRGAPERDVRNSNADGCRLQEAAAIAVDVLRHVALRSGFVVHAASIGYMANVSIHELGIDMNVSRKGKIQRDVTWPPSDAENVAGALSATSYI